MRARASLASLRGLARSCRRCRSGKGSRAEITLEVEATVVARRRLRDTAAAKTHGAQGGVPRASSLRFRPLPRRPTGPKEGNSVAAATWERGLEAQCAAAERAMSPEMKMTTLTKKPMRINTDVRRSPRIRIRSPPEAVRYNAMLRHMFALRNPASPPAATCPNSCNILRLLLIHVPCASGCYSTLSAMVHCRRRPQRGTTADCACALALGPAGARGPLSPLRTSAASSA